MAIVYLHIRQQAFHMEPLVRKRLDRATTALSLAAINIHGAMCKEQYRVLSMALVPIMENQNHSTTQPQFHTVKLVQTYNAHVTMVRSLEILRINMVAVLHFQPPVLRYPLRLKHSRVLQDRRDQLRKQGRPRVRGLLGVSGPRRGIRVQQSTNADLRAITNTLPAQHSL